MNESATGQTFRGHEVRRETLTIGGRRIDLTWPRDVDALLDSPKTHARFAQNEYLPYWAQPWPAGVLLAEQVLAGPAGNGRRAIEIGCGIGLVSVAAGLMGWRVTASDYDEDALAFAELNAQRNGVTLESTRLVDFAAGPSDERYDCVLAADVFYERRLCEPVARWMASALAPGGQGMASDPNRSAANDFPKYLSAYGLTCRTEPASTSSPSGLVTNGRIWWITATRPSSDA